MRTSKQFPLVLELQARKYGGYLVVFALIMVIVALGVAVGFSYLMSPGDEGGRLFLATGAPTIVLIMVALVIVPNQNAGAKLEGYIDFVKSLPSSRKSFLVADAGLWALITIPAIAVSVLVANWIFDPGFAVSWWVIPAYLLMLFSCFGIGYGYSFLFHPEAAMALSQILAFGALMFSPINYPMERLPEWLQSVHEVLPIYHMAEVMRASLAHTAFEAEAISYIILGAWAVVGFFGAARFLEKA